MNVPFVPSNASTPPFQTQVVLDGDPYQLACAWNIYRADWYVSLSSQSSGAIVANQPLVGSPLDRDIPLFPGLFTTSVVLYRPSTGNFEILP